MNIVQKENESGSYRFQISFYCHAIGQKARSLQDWTPWLSLLVYPRTELPRVLPHFTVRNQARAPLLPVLTLMGACASLPRDSWLCAPTVDRNCVLLLL